MNFSHIFLELVTTISAFNFSHLFSFAGLGALQGESLQDEPRLRGDERIHTAWVNLLHVGRVPNPTFVQG